MLQSNSLILGTPSYGDGQLPGVVTGVKDGSWEEFLPQLMEADFTSKCIALYGLGNQNKYPDRFGDSLFTLYTALQTRGALIAGSWSADGYQFEQSKAMVDDRFVGMMLDQHNQGLLTEQRIAA